ncbi:hypothetical protein MMPV_005005 [Pyropia vietnamensis]
MAGASVAPAAAAATDATAAPPGPSLSVVASADAAGSHTAAVPAGDVVAGAAAAMTGGTAAGAAASPGAPPQVLVLDAGALIGGSENLLTLRGLKEVLSGPAEGVEPAGTGGDGASPAAALWTSRLRSTDAAFYTVADVGAEARDVRARRHWELLRPWVTVRVPSPRAMAAVTSFARATGDLPALSLTDVRVLALAVDLEWARGVCCDGRLGARVSDAAEAAPVTTLAAAAMTEGDGDDGAARAVQGAASVDAPPAVDAPLAPAAADCDESVIPGEAADYGEAGDVGGGAGKAITDMLQRPTSGEDAPAGSDSDWDDGPVSDPDDDGTGWIHPENLSDCLARDGLGESTAPAATPSGNGPTAATDGNGDGDGNGNGHGIGNGHGHGHGGSSGGRSPPPTLGTVPVGIVTTDFAMQNVVLQMGLRLLSVDGRRPVTAVRRHVLRCTPCGLLTRETDRRFCGHCGHAALIRLPYTVTADGVAVVAFDPHRRVNIRGTKYPIPRPRGGRAGHAGGDLVFAEDVAAQRALAAKHSARPRGSVGLGEGEKYNPGAVLVAAQRVRVGYGRRNVNAVRPGGGNRKKK